MEIVKFKNPLELTNQVINELVQISQTSTDKVHIALSGGSTPKLIFQQLALAEKKHLLDWSKLHFWWGDERCINFESDESNYGEAKRLLFDKIKGLPKENIHFINGDIDSTQASIAYVQEMKKYIPLKHGVPCFDWVWLGMGEDGHTASLFPNGISLDCDSWAAVAHHPVSAQSRVSLTLKTINEAQKISLLVTGVAKAKMINKVLGRSQVSKQYPVQFVAPICGELYWYLDEAAASLLVP